MFVYYINVPKNKEGIAELETYKKEMPNVETYELTAKTYDVLRKKGGLFEEIDSKLGTNIDVCEEERINSSQIDLAITITEKYIKHVREKNEILECKPILDSLIAAKKAGTFWEIDIYVE